MVSRSVNLICKRDNADHEKTTINKLVIIRNNQDSAQSKTKVTIVYLEIISAKNVLMNQNGFVANYARFPAITVLKSIRENTAWHDEKKNTVFDKEI